jgi:hypothetical protein
MLQGEIIRTCSYEKVAEAAVLSIGVSFRQRMSLLAATNGQSTGAYVAALVRRFEEEAGPREMHALGLAIAGADMPVLAGLRWVVETMIDDDRMADGRRRSPVSLRANARGVEAA